MSSDAAVAATALVRPSEARRASAGLWSDAVWRVRHDPTTLAALGVLVLLVLLAAGADLLAVYVFHTSYTKQDILSSYAKPSGTAPAMWLGADQLGRSQIVRLLYAGRVSLFIGVFGAATSLVIGMVLGVTAGYFRGRWDDIVV